MFTKRHLDLLIKLTVNFIVFAAPVVFWQPSMDPFGPAQLMVIRVFVPFLFLLLSVRAYLEGRFIFKKNAALPPLTAYLAVALISVFFAYNKGISLKYFFELALFMYGAYLIYAVSGRQDVERLLVLVMVSHTLMSVYGIMQHFGSDIFSWNTNFNGRPMGTIGNPDFFAGQLLVPIFIAGAYLVFGARHRVLAGIALAINVLCLYYTKVLGAYIGFIAGAVSLGMVFIAARPGKRKKFIAVFLAAVFILAAITGPFAVKKAAGFFNDKKRSMTHRLLMWEASLDMIRESPVFGKGVGNYRLYYPLYQARLLNDPKNKEFDYVVTWMPHQNYLLIASETGLLGLGLFLLVISVFYAGSYDVFIKKKDFSPVPAGIFAAVTAVLMASFVNTFYNIAATTLCFFIFIFVQYLYTGREGAYVLDRKKTGIAAFIAAAVLVMFIAADGRTMVSNVYLKKAVKEEKDRDLVSALAHYDRIISMKPVELCPQTDVAQYYYAAEAYREAGDLKKAQEYYAEDLKINPYCPEVNNMLGAVTGQLGGIEQAIRLLKLSIYIAPHYDAAYMNLATAYASEKDYSDARNIIEKYINENGHDQKFDDMLKAVDRARQTGKP